MGMVVRTNTMALNAYRQLGMNNSAVAKSLEKLSSGFRINRAGDDAAGLAISEKMKAQIKGLETASANAQDGISLIQTAEGNLNEVHDMLNRMVELATKSANGTYTATERSALQDEVNQLLDEIDRISQSANFNGAKLLDGSLDGVGTKIVGTPAFSSLNSMKLAGVGGGEVDEVEGGVKADGTTPVEEGKGILLHKDPVGGSGKTSFEIDLQGFTATVPKDADGKEKELGDQYLKLIALDKDGANGNKVASIKYNVTPNEGKITGADIAKALDGTTFNINFGTAADPVNIEYEITMGKDGESLVFTMTDTGYQNALNADAAKVQANLDVFQGNFNFTSQFLYTKGAYKEDGSGDFKDGIDKKDYALPVTGFQDSTTSVVKAGGKDNAGQRAEAVLDFEARGVEIKDGAGVKIGDEYYVWAGTDETLNTNFGDNVKVIDIRDLVDEDGKLVKEAFSATGKPADNQGTYTNQTKALNRLTVAAADNKMFNVQINNVGTTIVFDENVDNPNSENLKTLEGMKKELMTFDKISANVTTVGGKGKALTLQIGDTADEFNKMSVNIADMSAKGLNISGLDITSEEKASDAIDKIKTAINTVSTARAGMGALQNRLEHTINNLDVAVENLSAANSRIRDTDMAKEMMNYTKMNVLVQSAQAMLAQANQQPQSVLQLLQ